VRRLTIVAAVALLLYTVFGFFGVPLLVRHVGLPRLAERIDGTVTLQHVRCNPFLLALQLEEFEILDRAGDRVFAFDRFDGNFQLIDTVLRSGYHFRRAFMTRPFVHMEFDEQRQLNLARLLKPAPSPDPAERLTEIPRVVVREMGLGDAELRFRDRSLPEPFAADIVGLSFNLDGFDTAPEASSPLVLEGRSPDGERIRWEGSFTLAPVSSRGALTLTDIRLPRFMPYALSRFDGRLVDGSVTVELSYELAPMAAPRVATIDVAEAVFRDLSVEQAGERWLDVPELVLRDVRADGHARTIGAGSVTMAAPSITAIRAESGELRLTSLVKRRAAERAGAAEDVPAPTRLDPATLQDPIAQMSGSLQQLLADVFGPWSVRVESIDVSDGTMTFADRSTRTPVDLRLADVAFRAGPVSSEEAWRVPLDLSLTIGEGGSLAITGEAVIGERRAELEVRGDGVPLALLAGYLPAELPPLPPAELRDALAALDGRLTVSFLDGAARWSGRAVLEGVRLEREGGAALLEVASLELDGEAESSRGEGEINLTWTGTATVADASLSEAPLAGPVSARVAGLDLEGSLELRRTGDAPAELTVAGEATIDEATVDAPETALRRLALGRGVIGAIDVATGAERYAAGTVTLEAPSIVAVAPLLAADPEEQAAATAERTRPAITLSVAELRIEGGALELRDERSTPPAVITADEVHLQASDLTTAGGTLASIDLRSRLQRSGQLAVSGRVDAFADQPSADVRVEISTLPLQPYTPLAVSYAGHEVDSGRLMLTLPLTVDSGQLTGTLDVDLVELDLGRRIDSPAAPDVPLELGLTLLRDPSGHIRATIPISGDMNDPQFSLGGVIWQAFLNLLLNAATAPFQLLGSAFGAESGVDLSFVEFEPGTDRLAVDSTPKLEVLGRAMKERPAMRIRVVGGVAPETDMIELHRELLREALLQSERQRDPSITSLSGDAYRAAVARLFAERIGGPDAHVSFENMEQALSVTFDVPPERLVALANRRGSAAAETLVQDEGVAKDRVTVVEPSPEQLTVPTPRATFELY
jgi:hypothetical protein